MVWGVYVGQHLSFLHGRKATEGESGSEPDLGRAKLNPKPWNREGPCEIGCCYPVGRAVEGTAQDNPTWLKPSQQARSEPACYSSNGVYEAGCSVSAGCVIEPRNRYRCGP